LLETVFDTTFTVADADSLIQGTDRLQPTMIVLDLAVAEGEFAGLIRQLRKSSVASKVIALTVHNDPAVVDALLSAGADGVVLKHMIAGDLMVAIDKTLEGGSFGMPDTGPIQR
jgi:DNA-binding NarL/FixJ family response regulator